MPYPASFGILQLFVGKANFIKFGNVIIPYLHVPPGKNLLFPDPGFDILPGFSGFSV
jgi:hypothetical protein